MNKKSIWKTIDDINIVCKKCEHPMKLESTLNGICCIFVCLVCKEHVYICIGGEKKDGAKTKL